MNERIDRLNCFLLKAKTIFTDSETALTMTSADTDSTSESDSDYVDSDLYELQCMHLFSFKIYVFGSL